MGKVPRREGKNEADTHEKISGFRYFGTRSAENWAKPPMGMEGGVAAKRTWRTLDVTHTLT